MLEVRVDVKNSFGFIDNNSKHFIPGHGVFSMRLESHLHDNDVYIRHKDKKANAKNSWQVCDLNIQDGDEVWFEIHGKDEYGALATLLEICKIHKIV